MSRRRRWSSGESNAVRVSPHIRSLGISVIDYGCRRATFVGLLSGAPRGRSRAGRRRNKSREARPASTGFHHFCVEHTPPQSRL